jgi:hypothetical protein
LCIHATFFIHLLVNEQLVWFYSLDFLNDAIINMTVQVSLLCADWHSHVLFLVSFGNSILVSIVEISLTVYGDSFVLHIFTCICCFLNASYQEDGILLSLWFVLPLLKVLNISLCIYWPFVLLPLKTICSVLKIILLLRYS